MHSSQGCNKEDVLLVFINFSLLGHLWLSLTVKGASQANVQALCEALLHYIKSLFKKGDELCVNIPQRSIFNFSLLLLDIWHLTIKEETVHHHKIKVLGRNGQGYIILFMFNFVFFFSSSGFSHFQSK